MSKFVTLVLEPRFNDEYGEYANLPVFNAHGDIVGYTGGEVPETGNPCEFYVMDEEGFPACHSASENAKLIVKLNAEHIVRQNVEAENAKLREEVEQWHRLTDGIELPEYPITEFKPKDLERENAKLRELVGDIWEFGFSNSAGANSVKEWYRVRDELEQRVYAALGSEVDG